MHVISEPYLQDNDEIKPYLSVHMDVICELYVQDKPYHVHVISEP